MLSANKLAYSENQKKVLIISYYWPPAGGSGVQRWVKFAKYLPENGWQPTIFTPSNPEYPAIDHSLLSDVKSVKTITLQIFEPYSIFRKLTGSKNKVGAGFVSENESVGIAQKLAIWIRGNLFVPDARRFFVNPAIKSLSELLKREHFDAIVSTGPPHSMHLIALSLHRKFGIPWLADFRDPWTQVYYFDDLKPGIWARKRHKKLEKKTLTMASSVCVVSNGMAKEMSEIVHREFDVVTNGFDSEDFTETERPRNEIFTITYSGTLLPSQYAETFWTKLSELSTHFDFKIDFFGRVDVTTRNIISDVNLDSHSHFHGYVEHKIIVNRISVSDCNLLILPNLPQSSHILTGKVFEYLAAKRPIFALGTPNSEVANLIESHKAGYYHTFEDSKGIQGSLHSLFDGSHPSFSFDNIEKYSRENLSKRIAGILNQMTPH